MEITTHFAQFVQDGRYLRGWSPRTAAIYQTALDSFLQFKSGLEEDPSKGGSPERKLVTKSELDAWVVTMRREARSAGGCNVLIRSMNSFLSWLYEQGHLSAPLRVKPQPSPAKPLDSFSEADVQALLSFKARTPFQLRAWVLTLCLMDTGIRIDEALGLERSKVDLDAGFIRVLGKGRKERVVPFSREFRKHLFRLVRQPGDGPYVFHAARGQRLRYRNVYRDIRRVCELAGVSGARIHPHAFRHFFAVNYIRSGGDIYRLSRILGHTSIATTQLYLRSMTNEQVGEAHRSPLTPRLSA